MRVKEPSGHPRDDSRGVRGGEHLAIAALDKLVDVGRGIFCGLFRALARDVQPTSVLVRASLKMSGEKTRLPEHERVSVGGNRA